MAQGTARPIKTALYVEGKRLDNAFISATVSSQVGKPATAVISLVPTNSIRHILPRTYIQLFSNDPWDSDPSLKLLFDGEVMGIGFVKNDDGRSFVIHCADVSNYWHHVRQYWFNLTQSGGNFLDEFIRMTTGGAATVSTVAPFGVKGYIIQRLNLIPNEENKFLDSMIGLLDDIGNISAFYQNARRRLRITDRIARRNSGSVQNLLQLSFFSDWVQQLVQARSGETNLLTIITLLLNIIYHEYVSVLAPPFLPQDVIKRDAQGNPIRKKDGKRSIKEVETEKRFVIGNFIFKPHIYTLPPPSCNVLMPNMYDGVQYNRNFMDENTRMTLTPQVIERGSLQALKLKVFKRPVELDNFFTLITEKNKQIKKRPDKAKYGDGQGQSALVQEWEFFTNEERFKGINPKFQSLAPAPAILSLQNQGAKDDKGRRKGGVPKYLHNVASYEYTMSKFVTRSIAVNGLYNIRPVPGYPMLVVDDSDANLNLVAYLQGISHTLHASSGVSTSYSLVLPREVDEIDLNRPRLDERFGRFEFVVNDAGERVFNFDRMFDSENVPPIPEWFDDDFKTVDGLTKLYKKLLGPEVKSSEDIRDNAMFLLEVEKKNIAIESEGLGPRAAVTSAVAKAATNTLFRDSVQRLINDYNAAKAANQEFEFSSTYTARSFTTVNDAFSFLGARPKNVSDSGEVPDADTEYVGEPGFLAFTEAEIDPDGEETSLDETPNAVYDGRPIPHPFELELYNDSVSKAQADQEKITKAGKKRTLTSTENAPTGSGVEDIPFKPLSYPLSEREVVRARRSIINSYRAELESKRGFRG